MESGSCLEINTDEVIMCEYEKIASSSRRYIKSNLIIETMRFSKFRYVLLCRIARKNAAYPGDNILKIISPGVLLMLGGCYLTHSR